MSQADYTIADQDGASFLVDINSQLAAIVSNNSGATEPSTTFAYQWWADTSSGLLKMRNAANNAWVTIGTLASANLGLLALSGGTLTGALNEAQGANIASSGTVNLTTSTGNYVHITGTTTITAVILAQGAERTVVFVGALTLTNGSNLLLPTASNIMTAAGDTAVFRGEASSVVRCVSYIKKDGTTLGVSKTTDKIQHVTVWISANALNVAIYPTVLDFRSTTLAVGIPITRALTGVAWLSVLNAATLGTINAIQARLAILAIDNAGTIEAAIVNLAGGNNLDETTLISTTALSTASDSANVIYSTTARTNVAYRVVGFVESTQATAGTWATAPTKVQGAGGISLVSVALNSIGDTPMFACRAWVNFNGTGTVAIRASGNVSSITDNGVGDYTINFTTAMPDANYSLAGSAQDNNSDARGVLSPYSPAAAYPFTTTTARIRISGNSTTFIDVNLVCANFFR